MSDRSSDGPEDRALAAAGLGEELRVEYEDRWERAHPRVRRQGHEWSPDHPVWPRLARCVLDQAEHEGTEATTVAQRVLGSWFGDPWAASAKHPPGVLVKQFNRHADPDAPRESAPARNGPRRAPTVVHETRLPPELRGAS